MIGNDSVATSVRQGTDGKVDRRRKDNRRNKVYQLRMNDDEEEILESLCVITDDPKSEVIRKALGIYYKIKCAGGNF